MTDPSGQATLQDCFILTEQNGQEGETWQFLVPLEGNEEACSLVESFVHQLHQQDEESNSTYSVSRQTLHIASVMKAASLVTPGYHHSHTVIPKLDLQKVREEFRLDRIKGDPDDETEDLLYKGGLLRFAPEEDSEDP